MTIDQSPSHGLILSERVYNILKPTTQIVIPGLATLYFALAGIWGESVFPQADRVTGTATAVTVFLGLILGLSSRNYHNSDAKFDGTIEVEQPLDGPKRFNLVLTSDPYDLDQKKQATFKIETN